jgi:hypothetical protein
MEMSTQLTDLVQPGTVYVLEEESINADRSRSRSPEFGA